MIKYSAPSLYAPGLESFLGGQIFFIYDYTPNENISVNLEMESAPDKKKCWTRLCVLIRIFGVLEKWDFVALLQTIKKILLIVSLLCIIFCVLTQQHNNFDESQIGPFSTTTTQPKCA